MINELYALSLALEKNGIQVPLKHPWIEGVKKGEALLVNVDRDGQVESIEYCSSERVATFWNISESKHKTFPKLNIDPLWGKIEDRNLLVEIVEAGKKKNWSEWFDLTRKIIATYPDIVCREEGKKIIDWQKDKWRRLYEFPHKYILPYIGQNNHGLTALIESFSSWKEFSASKVNKLMVQIVRKALTDLENGRMDCFKLVQDLVVGRPAAKTQPQVTVIFNPTGIDAVVADENECHALSRALLDKDSGGRKYQCPLTGELSKMPVKKYPDPNLPVLGKSFLMAMNKDTPCHKRYEKNGVAIFPASQEVSSKLDNTLCFITAPDKQGKTWISVASGKWDGTPKKEKKDLLVAYAENLPDYQNSSPHLALMIGGVSQEEQKFENVSSIVCDAIARHRTVETSAFLRFFVIRRISKGQSQVVLNDYCQFSELIRAVDTWKQAAANCPAFSLYLSTMKGVKAKKCTPPVPFPADISRLLQFQWIRGGTDFHKLDGCPLVVGYDLFFERGPRTQATARQVLQMVLQRTTSLLLGIGSAQQTQTLGDFSVAAKSSALMAVSFIGIALFKLGIGKEVYMKDVGYSIGRLLSLTDCLHKEYCKLVRGGNTDKNSIPNQLLGNTILRTVLDSPVRGLARLSERIPVYKAWIDRQEGEKFKLAHWAKNEMGKISEQLSGMTIPDSTDDALKAQILLGYLAHVETKQKQ